MMQSVRLETAPTRDVGHDAIGAVRNRTYRGRA